MAQQLELPISDPTCFSTFSDEELQQYMLNLRCSLDAAESLWERRCYLRDPDEADFEFENNV
jgi:hypothetical protein